MITGKSLFKMTNENTFICNYLINVKGFAKYNESAHINSITLDTCCSFFFYLKNIALANFFS